MIKKKTLFKIIAGIVAFLAIVSIGASFYFFHVAQVRGDKSFISHAATPKSSPVYQDEKDFLKLDKENLSLKNDGLNLKLGMSQLKIKQIKQSLWCTVLTVARNKWLLTVCFSIN